MTREEAIFILRGKRDISGEKTAEALDMAIKALEQEQELFKAGLLKDCESCKEEFRRYLDSKESCEDAVSRQAVDDALYEYSRNCDVNYGQIMEYIDKLPSVQPTRKRGKWIIEYGTRTCTECGYSGMTKDDWGDFIPDNFCPNCGSDNREVGE